MCRCQCACSAPAPVVPLTKPEPTTVTINVTGTLDARELAKVIHVELAKLKREGWR